MNHTDATPLPWPAAWPAPRGLTGPGWTLCGSAVVVAVVAVGVALVLPLAVQSRVTVLAALVLPVLGSVLSCPVTRANVRARPASRVHPTGSGELSVPFLPELWVGIWLVLTGCVVILAMLVGASWHVGFGRPPDPAATVVGVVLLMAAAPFAALGIEGLRGTASRGELLLSPDGIRYRTFAYDAWLDWTAVRRVSVVRGDGLPIVLVSSRDRPPRLRPHSWVLRPSSGSLAAAREGRLVVRGALLSVDPALAFHTLHYYHANPDARAELGTDAAAHRVRSAAVLTG